MNRHPNFNITSLLKVTGGQLSCLLGFYCQLTYPLVVPMLTYCCRFSQDLAQQSTFVDLNTPYCIYCCTNEQPMDEKLEPAASIPSFGAPSASAAGVGDWEERRMFTRLSACLASAGVATAAGRAAACTTRDDGKGNRCILEPLLACSTCPASFHPSCYLEGAGELVITRVLSTLLCAAYLCTVRVQQ